MKSAVALGVLFFAALALARPDEDHYTERFDNIDLDEILSNENILKNYFNCIMDKGPCTVEGKELKAHIKEALETKCAKCTDAQKKGCERVIGHLINNKPEYWDELCAKYDPDKKYSTKYEEELKKVKG